MIKNPQQKFSLALVTGASSGIGEALARLLASQGINLLITGRDENRLKELAQELQMHVNVTAFTADLADEKGRRSMEEIILKHVPELVINNAGFGLYGDTLNHPIPEQLKILTVNGNAVLEFTLYAAEALIAQNKTGTILNVSSAASYYIFPA